MKLYHLTPINFGSEWFVMSDSRNNAIESIIKKIENDGSFVYSKIERNLMNHLRKGNVPYDYKLEEYNENEVVNAEIS
jgi:hypothetical protein